MPLWALSWDHILTSPRERYWPYSCAGTEGGSGTNSAMFHHVLRKAAEVTQRGQWQRGCWARHVCSIKKQPHRTHCSEDTGKALQCSFSSVQPEHTFDHAGAWCLSLLSLEHGKRCSACYSQVQLLAGVFTPITLTIDGSQDDT